MYDDYIQTNGWCVKVIITMLSWVQHHYELYCHESKCEAYLSLSCHKKADSQEGHKHKFAKKPFECGMQARQRKPSSPSATSSGMWVDNSTVSTSSGPNWFCYTWTEMVFDRVGIEYCPGVQTADSKTERWQELFTECNTSCFCSISCYVQSRGSNLI